MTALVFIAGAIAGGALIFLLSAITSAASDWQAGLDMREDG